MKLIYCLFCTTAQLSSSAETVHSLKSLKYVLLDALWKNLQTLDRDESVSHSSICDFTKQILLYQIALI